MTHHMRRQHDCNDCWHVCCQENIHLVSRMNKLDWINLFLAWCPVDGLLCLPDGFRSLHQQLAAIEAQFAFRMNDRQPKLPHKTNTKLVQDTCLLAMRSFRVGRFFRRPLWSTMSVIPTWKGECFPDDEPQVFGLKHKNTSYRAICFLGFVDTLACVSFFEPDMNASRKGW